ncbi:hypothetical protein AYO44_06855 [Planctomycetaceae bacterium SCGC AG-212-F19]|nr:hypothetical protein AYO44_06855 [Planctomycetaceae bacterium SCGC AG-212-F19]
MDPVALTVFVPWAAGTAEIPAMAKAKQSGLGKEFSVKPTLASVRAWLRRHVKAMVAEGMRLRAEVAKKKGMQAEFLNGSVLYFAYMAEFTGVVLKDGELFTERVPGDTHWKKRKKPQAKDCFFNAQTLCIEGDLLYYEGYYFSKLPPVQHAFNVLDGKVIDVTRDAIDKQVGPSEGFWFGATVSKDDLEIRLAKTDQWGPALLPDAPVIDD